MYKILEHHLLLPQTIKKLRQYNIDKIGKFLQEPDQRLKEITGLHETVIKTVKEGLRFKYEDDDVKIKISSQEHIRHLQQQTQIIPTGIEQLDNVLNGGLLLGSIIEISGESSSGKTQLCNTLAINLIQHGFDCFWLDTKMDFNTVRCERIQMLRCPGSDGHKLLSRIYVQRAFDKESFLDALYSLKDGFDKGLLIIDSVTALINLYMGPQYKLREQCIIQMINCVRKLCIQKQFIVIFTSLFRNDMYKTKFQGSQGSQGFEEKSYWNPFSTEKLYLTHVEKDPEKFNINTIKNTNKRHLYLIKSNLNKELSQMPIELSITDAGIS